MVSVSLNTTIYCPMLYINEQTLINCLNLISLISPLKIFWPIVKCTKKKIRFFQVKNTYVKKICYYDYLS